MADRLDDVDGDAGTGIHSTLFTTKLNIPMPPGVAVPVRAPEPWPQAEGRPVPKITRGTTDGASGEGGRS